MKHLGQRAKSFVKCIEHELEGDRYFVNNDLFSFIQRLDLLSDVEKRE